ncbi:hypothetical protein [Phycicoccus sp.]|uniref:hypothetical protein n=1 Tax=Phycicoccus sp. TaxID=1902410 RepID=UPI002C5F4B64|nr:hypothetical protein [Phycicoccus sp.]HMM96248.1 hypothetical protein [Phycicoccus sp.]
MSLFLSDREHQTAIDEAGWRQPDVALRRVLVGPFDLQIATARYDVVPVQIRVLSGPPSVEAGAEHAVEVDLQVPSGKLVLETVTEDSKVVPDIPVTPGRYRVRITYMPRTEPPPEGSDSEAFGDHFDYGIDLWLSPRPNDPAVLVQGREVWAG